MYGNFKAHFFSFALKNAYLLMHYQKDKK